MFSKKYWHILSGAVQYPIKFSICYYCTWDPRSEKRPERDSTKTKLLYASVTSAFPGPLLWYFNIVPTSLIKTRMLPDHLKSIRLKIYIYKWRSIRREAIQSKNEVFFLWENYGDVLFVWRVSSQRISIFLLLIISLITALGYLKYINLQLRAKGKASESQREYTTHRK